MSYRYGRCLITAAREACRFAGLFSETPMKNVVVEVRCVYGVKLIYPANDNARLLAQLAGKKTLSAKDLHLICALGFEVTEIFPPLDLPAIPLRWSAA